MRSDGPFERVAFRGAYGVLEAAEVRSNGDGTNAGLWRKSDGPSAGTSSGPSAGVAGSAAFVLAYCARILSSSVPLFVVFVLWHADSKPRASKQVAIFVIIFFGLRIVGKSGFYRRSL